MYVWFFFSLLLPARYGYVRFLQKIRVLLAHFGVKLSCQFSKGGLNQSLNGAFLTEEGLIWSFLWFLFCLKRGNFHFQYWRCLVHWTVAKFTWLDAKAWIVPPRLSKHALEETRVKECRVDQTKSRAGDVSAWQRNLRQASYIVLRTTYWSLRAFFDFSCLSLFRLNTALTWRGKHFFSQPFRCPRAGAPPKST